MNTRVKGIFSSFKSKPETPTCPHCGITQDPAAMDMHISFDIHINGCQYRPEPQDK